MVKTTLARSERQVSAIIERLGILRQNIGAMKRALPFN
jgi:hypothetical protein